ncbi:MAG: type II toxin-antitoxin system HicB family antitoxin [Planctomycetota bacterium]
MNYPIVVLPLPEEDGGGYAGVVLDLKGCISDGDTPEEAVANAQLAAQEWLSEQKRLGREVPEPGCHGEEAKKKRQKLVEAVSELLERYEALENKYGDLEGQLRMTQFGLKKLLEEGMAQPNWYSLSTVPAVRVPAFIAKGGMASGRLRN